MDPLSDLLRVVRLDGAFFYAVEAAGPWIVESAPAKELKPQILPASEHLISYHILTGGRCFVRLIGEQPVELLPGDVIVFPHGDPNVMSSGRDLRAPGVTASFPDRYP
ncbi:MAG TPA: cupin domain-containing protein, partial [Gemmatimonadales bacterium]|nr:cupin domain-containing protein [Gemmatimonadales bacterium]